MQWLPSILYTWASEKLSKKIKKELEIPDPPQKEGQIAVAEAKIDEEE